MSMKIRLARGGSKKRPFYSIVASDSRMPRDGRFLEKLGTYNPLLAKGSEDRVKMDMDRVTYWLSQGAQPTDRVARFLEAAGALPKTVRNNPKAAVPGKRMADLTAKKATRDAAPVVVVEPAAPVVAVEPAVAEAAVETVAEAAVETVAEAAVETVAEAAVETVAEAAVETAEK
jgi:small subunit ribosomal protein S16